MIQFLFGYEFGSGLEFYVARFPLDPSYGDTPAEAHAKVIEQIGSASPTVVLGRGTVTWTTYRDTVMGVWTWTCAPEQGGSEVEWQQLVLVPPALNR